MFPHAASPNTSLQEILTASQTTKTSENLWTFTVHRLFSSIFKVQFANAAAFKVCLLTHPSRAPRLHAAQVPIDILYRISP